MNKNNLENYYSGDFAWHRFLSLYEDCWNDNSTTTQLITYLKGNVDIAKVIYGKFGESSLSVITQSVPALEGLSIIDCVNDLNHIRRLKECLMRMP